MSVLFLFLVINLFFSFFFFFFANLLQYSWENLFFRFPPWCESNQQKLIDTHYLSTRREAAEPEARGRWNTSTRGRIAKFNSLTIAAKWKLQWQFRETLERANRGGQEWWAGWRGRFTRGIVLRNYSLFGRDGGRDIGSEWMDGGQLWMDDGRRTGVIGDARSSHGKRHHSALHSSGQEPRRCNGNMVSDARFLSSAPNPYWKRGSRAHLKCTLFSIEKGARLSLFSIPRSSEGTSFQ